MRKNQFIDYTLLAPQIGKEEVVRICKEAKKYGFYSVCINPFWVGLAFDCLEKSDVKVCSVVGFPLGANTSTVKAFEAKEAEQNGADEIDMVLNIGLVKQGDWSAVQDDIKSVVDAVSSGTNVKVILETCLLSEDEIQKACDAAVKAGANFVKTSTGFSTAGATVPHVKLMRERVGQDFGVKASGGVRSAEDIEAMLVAGANRIGTSTGVFLLGKEIDGGNDVY